MKSLAKFKKKRVKEYRNLLMSGKIHDFDFTSILYVERLQMLRVAKAISTESIRHEGWERDVYWIKLAVKILDLYLNDTWWTIENGKTIIKPYVNIKNFKKYRPNLTQEEIDSIDIDMRKQIIYEEKLWNIYNKIRTNYMRIWWT